MATNPTFVPATPPNPPSNLTQPALTPQPAGNPSVHGAAPTPEETFVNNAESQARGENQYWDWLWKTNPKEVWKSNPQRAAAYKANEIATDAARTLTPNSEDAESLGGLVIPKPEETATKEGIIAPEPEEIKSVSDIPGAIPVNEKRYAWRGAGADEEEISGAPHDQASESMQEARDYARRKNGKVQRIDLTMLPKNSYEISGGVGTPNLYRFKQPVPKEAIETVESFHPRNKIVPPEKTTGEYDTPIKNGGGVPAGIMRKVGKMEHDLVLFHDPQTGSTLALPADKISPGNVQQHLIESRAKFASGAKSKEISNLPGAIRAK